MITILRPCRIHRPVWLIVPHLQLAEGCPQLRQRSPLITAIPGSLIRHPVCAVLTGMDTGDAPVPAVAPVPALLAVAGDFADEHSKSATKDESVLHVETRLVEVNVVAQDSKGNAVTDLTRDDFTLFDNG